MNYCKLGDLAQFVNGYGFSQTDWTNEGYPIIRIQNLTGTQTTFNRTTKNVDSRYLIRSGDLLVSWSASLGVYVYEGGDALLNQHIFKVVPDAKCDKAYLFYGLNFLLEDLKRNTHGATMKHITKGKFERHKLYLPEIKEQKRIATILDKADAIRKKRQKAIAELDNLLRATFLDMFGDPINNSKGWKVYEMGEIAESVNYGTSSKATEEISDLPILRMGNLTYNGQIDLSDLKYIGIPKKDLPKYTVQKGDVLFNRTNSRELVGKTAYWDLDQSMAFAGYLIRIRFDENKALGSYIAAALNTSAAKKMLFSMAKPAVNMSNLSASDFKRIKLAIPPLDLQKRYHNVAEEIKTKFNIFMCTAEQTEKLFKNLMHCTFGGKQL